MGASGRLVASSLPYVPSTPRSVPPCQPPRFTHQGGSLCVRSAKWLHIAYHAPRAARCLRVAFFTS
jgi:hypothetical protein